MVSEKLKLVNPQGFHMRPANDFAAQMAKYDADIRLIAGNQKIDGKSLMNIMAAGLRCGAQLEVVCDGPDEEEMLRTAAKMIRSGFGEL